MATIATFGLAFFALNIIFWGECRATSTTESLPKEEVPFAIPYQWRPFSTNYVLRCGEVLTAPTGQIMYKVNNETVLQNERCIWTVAVPNAKGYRVYPAMIGFPSNETYLSLTGLSNREGVIANYNVSVEGLEFQLMNTNVLVITFNSDKIRNATSSGGFFLMYVSTSEGSTYDVNQNSRHEIVGPNTFRLRHPQTGSYLNYEMSTFVFPPVNNIHGNRFRSIEFNSIDFENTFDYILVYIFDSSSNQWSFEGRISNSSNGTDVIQSSDAILLVFSTDRSVTRDGFDLQLLISCDLH